MTWVLYVEALVLRVDVLVFTYPPSVGQQTEAGEGSFVPMSVLL